MQDSVTSLFTTFAKAWGLIRHTKHQFDFFIPDAGFLEARNIVYVLVSFICCPFRRLFTEFISRGHKKTAFLIKHA